ncbi:MAG: peptide chain release factor N(5)-glutamine methyltransferase [Candidatus Omnitrophica bacterium]|nr:peptide chain release factor N(5)-glutamine methyltransferase [Candidatus Omnitrophota bacterium]
MNEPNRLIADASRRLARSGRGLARREAEWVLGHVVGLPPLELYLRATPVTAGEAERFWSIIEARAQGAPLQYALGTAEFFGRPFRVGPGVFIPRPETEAIAHAALEAFRALHRNRLRPLRFLEFGVGSGCLAVTIACELPTCRLVGIEVSWSALAIARENIQRHGVGDRVALIQGHWERPLAEARFDGIIANPPYVPTDDLTRLPVDVRQEPRESLDGGPDGMTHVRRLLSASQALLEPGGVVVVECGEDQVDLLMAQAAAAPWVAQCRAVTDVAQRPRGLVITARPSP